MANDTTNSDTPPYVRMPHASTTVRMACRLPSVRSIHFAMAVAAPESAIICPNSAPSKNTGKYETT